MKNPHSISDRKAREVRRSRMIDPNDPLTKAAIAFMAALTPEARAKIIEAFHQAHAAASEAQLARLRREGPCRQ